MQQQLIKKLKLEKYENIAIIKQAKEQKTVFTDYIFPTIPNKPLDLAIGFVYSLEEMKQLIEDVYQQKIVCENGMLYIVYPKINNVLAYPSIHRDTIFPYLHVDEETGYIKNTELKFNRMISLDDTYTIIGAKYLPVIKYKKTSRSSACVDDYITYIPKIEMYLEANTELLPFFKNLTYGYQKDWARYIYSAKTETTKEKRRIEMVEILRKGFKSKQLYKKSIQ